MHGKREFMILDELSIFFIHTWPDPRYLLKNEGNFISGECTVRPMKKVAWLKVKMFSAFPIWQAFFSS